ncbi:MAG: hypothetical protein IT326_04515 [Anaerolineae bacterium]|nr:hypothetical protein [Anaerolineae bacterium]
MLQAIAVSVLLSVSACRANEPTYVDRSLVDSGLITNEPCAPPCWQGIEIGDSRIDALAALLQNPLVSEVTEEGNEVWWTSSQTPGYGGGAIDFYQGTVATIYYEVEYRLEIQELIAVLGEPEAYVDSFDLRYYRNHARTLYWPERGIAVIVRGKLNRSGEYLQVRIRPESLVSFVSYYQQSESMVDACRNLSLVFGVSDSDCRTSFRAWEGYPGD